MHSGVGEVLYTIHRPRPSRNDRSPKPQDKRLNTEQIGGFSAMPQRAPCFSEEMKDSSSIDETILSKLAYLEKLSHQAISNTSVFEQTINKFASKLAPLDTISNIRMVNALTLLEISRQSVSEAKLFFNKCSLMNERVADGLTDLKKDFLSFNLARKAEPRTPESRPQRPSGMALKHSFSPQGFKRNQTPPVPQRSFNSLDKVKSHTLQLVEKLKKFYENTDSKTEVLELRLCKVHEMVESVSAIHRKRVGKLFLLEIRLNENTRIRSSI